MPASGRDDTSTQRPPWYYHNRPQNTASHPSSKAAGQCPPHRRVFRPPSLPPRSAPAPSPRRDGPARSLRRQHDPASDFHSRKTELTVLLGIRRRRHGRELSCLRASPSPHTGCPGSRAGGRGRSRPQWPCSHECDCGVSLVAVHVAFDSSVLCASMCFHTTVSDALAHGVCLG